MAALRTQGPGEMVRFHPTKFSGVSEAVSRLAWNQEIGGSIPPPLTLEAAVRYDSINRPGYVV